MAICVNSNYHRPIERPYTLTREAGDVYVCDACRCRFEWRGPFEWTILDHAPPESDGPPHVVK